MINDWEIDREFVEIITFKLIIASPPNESKRDSENRRKHKKDRPKKFDESRVHANESEVKREKKEKSNNRRDS